MQKNTFHLIYFFKDVDALKSTYNLIKSAHDGKSALDSLESFSFDLYVLCAEQAYQVTAHSFSWG